MPDRTMTIAPLRKAVTVPTTPARAFELFTAHIHEWWPLTTHSVGGSDAVGVALGEGIGGRIVETMADGTEEVWGTVTRWEPPQHLAYTWHAGTPAAEATQVEVTFTPDPAGGTLVELVHSGWERRPDGTGARSSYDTGWEAVLDAYVRRAGPPGVAT